MLSEVGFEDVRIVKRYDSFGGASKERVARKYGVIGVDVFARNP